MADLKPSTDGDWIRHAVRRYESRLVSYATHLLRDVDRARDVVQDVFLKLCAQDQVKQDRLQQHLAEWLFTVCRNACLDVKRKEKRMKPIDDAFAADQSAQGPSPDTVAEHHDSASVILKAMDELPHNQQEVIRLKFQHGMSYEQIANVTGLSVTNVGYLIHMGLKTVRFRLAASEKT